MNESITEAFLATKPEEERAQLILDLLDRVADALVDVSPPLKVLVTMRVAASFSIANGVKVDQFNEAAGRIFNDTLEDLQIFAAQMRAEEEARK